MATQATITGATSKVSIAGRVIDGVTDRPLAGVAVAITTGARAPHQATTAADGAFRFVNLPDGEYTLSFDLPSAGRRYGTTTVGITLKDGAREVRTVKLPPTGIAGKIDYPDQDPRSGTSMYPLVRLPGSGEEVYGEADGSYRVLAIEPGLGTPPVPRSLIITVPGYEPLAFTALIVRGQVCVVDSQKLTASTNR
ncbi:MAG: carboxypeptidase-like regulatory domain-containing protein [Byssovorax sp.]